MDKKSQKLILMKKIRMRKKNKHSTQRRNENLLSQPSLSPTLEPSLKQIINETVQEKESKQSNRVISFHSASAQNKNSSSRENNSQYKKSSTIKVFDGFQHSNSIEFSKGAFSNRVMSLRKNLTNEFEEIKDEELAEHGLNFIPNQLKTKFLAKLSGRNICSLRKGFAEEKAPIEDQNIVWDRIEIISSLDEHGEESL